MVFPDHAAFFYPPSEIASQEPRMASAKSRKVCIRGLGQMGLVCAGILAGKASPPPEPPVRGKRSTKSRAPDDDSPSAAPPLRHSATLPLDLVLWGHSTDE